MTSSAIEVHKNLEIYKNFQNKLEIYIWFKLEIFRDFLSMVDELNIRLTNNFDLFLDSTKWLTDLRIESLKFNAKHPLMVLYTKAGVHELSICHVELFKFCLFSSMPKMILNL